MSETREAPQPGEVQMSTDATDREAGRALEGLLFAEDGDDIENSGQEPDAGAGESPPTGSEDQGQTEAPAPRDAPIEPPRSWSAEDQAVFAKLPPEARAVIARRESEREAHFTRQTQTIAEERKGWETEREAITAQRNQYVQSLQQLTALAIPEAQQFQNVDWAKLSVEAPAEYVRLSGARDQLRGRIMAIQAEIQRVTEANATEQRKREESFLADQRTRLAERIPDFADTAKAPAVMREMRGFLRDTYGFTDAEINGVVDHRLVALGHDLMRMKQAEAARTSANTNNRANTAPRVQRPGATQGGDTTADQKTRALIGQLGRTNSTRDAGKLIESIFS